VPISRVLSEELPRGCQLDRRGKNMDNEAELGATQGQTVAFLNTPSGGI
jgi:hypothetical protein